VAAQNRSHIVALTDHNGGTIGVLVQFQGSEETKKSNGALLVWLQFCLYVDLKQLQKSLQSTSITSS